MTGEKIVAKYLKHQGKDVYTLKGGEAFLAKEIDDAISASWQDGHMEATNQSGLVKEDLFNDTWEKEDEEIDDLASFVYVDDNV
jgi:hypothetical protein